MRRIPAEARIAVVSNSQITPAREVREKFQRVKLLQEISVKERGWTLDVLNIVQRVTSEESEGRAPRVPNLTGNPTANLPGNLTGKEPENLGTRGTRPSGEFTNAEIYAHARELEQLHPDNRHIKDKIRQQLQVLRDRGFLTQADRGVWRLK